MCARHFARNTHLDYNVIEHTPHMNADIVIHLQCNIERLELGWYFILHIASIAPNGRGSHPPMGVAVISPMGVAVISPMGVAVLSPMGVAVIWHGSKLWNSSTST